MDDRQYFKRLMDNSILSIKQNRTLLVQKLTTDVPLKPVINYKLRTIDEVFAHFRPKIEITFQNTVGDTITEILYFKKLDDFGKKGLISISSFLQILSANVTDQINFNRQFKGNKLLKEVLVNPNEKAAFLNILQAMVRLLDEAENTEHVNNSLSKSINQPATIPVKEPWPTEPDQKIKKFTDQIAEYGRFDFVETTVEGVQSLNPAKKARTIAFLNNPDSRGDRSKLKKRIELFLILLEGHQKIEDMIAQTEQNIKELNETLLINQLWALNETKPLEIAYHSVWLFYKNADTEKVENLSIVNGTLNQLQNLDDTLFFDAIAEEIHDKYDRLRLNDNYSLLVLPGYLGPRKVLDRWARLAFENKVMLHTDYRDLDSTDEVLEQWDLENVSFYDQSYANVMMTCNYLVGRDPFLDIGEEEPLYLPPSTAVAGKIYKSMLQHPLSGIKHGSLLEVNSVRYELRKSELSVFEKVGLVPTVSEFGKVLIYAPVTLFNGDNPGMKIYTIVRTFDWIVKVLITFMDQIVVENWTYSDHRESKKQITSFLNSITDSGKIIEDFRIDRFERDPNSESAIILDLYIKPQFPALSFLVKLVGNRESWNAALK